MKKLILILLTLSLTVGLFVGCSPSDEPADGDNELKLQDEQINDKAQSDISNDTATDNTPTDEEPDDTNDKSIPFGVTAEELEAFYLTEIAPNQIIVKDDSGSTGCGVGDDGGPEYEFYDIYKSADTFFGRHRSVAMPFYNYVNECVKKGKVEVVYTPKLYACVRFLNLDKETFKEINESNRAFLEDPKNAGRQWGITTLTDEEIDIIYEGSYQDNVLWAKHPCAMVVGNSIYSYYDLHLLAQQNKLADTGIAREDFVEHIEATNAKRKEYLIDSLFYFTADKLESAAAQLKTRAELGIVTPPAVTE